MQLDFHSRLFCELYITNVSQIKWFTAKKIYNGIGTWNGLRTPLKKTTPREKIIFPPLHIKLGLIYQFVKSLYKEGECFKNICRTFQSVTNEKIKAGVFDGPQIRKLMNDEDFIGLMNTRWAIVDVARNFLGSIRSKNYVKIVKISR